MKRSPELADALFRSRQRQELTRVKSALPWFGEADVEFATATSQLDEQVRSEPKVARSLAENLRKALKPLEEVREHVDVNTPRPRN